METYNKDVDYEYTDKNGVQNHVHCSPRGWNSEWWTQVKTAIFAAQDEKREELITEISYNVGRCLSQFSQYEAQELLLNADTLLTNIAEHFSIKIKVLKEIRTGKADGAIDIVPDYLAEAHKSIPESAPGPGAVPKYIEEKEKNAGFGDEQPHGSLADISGDGCGELQWKLPPLDLYVFNEEVRKIIEGVSESKRLPPVLIAGLMLALASACVGRARAVKPRKDWQEHGNLFMILVAESGSGKSHAVNYIFQYLNKAEEAHKAKFKIELRQYLEDLGAYRKSKDPDKKMPEKPKNIQYILDDSTMEAASERMEDNPKGLLWMQDEMAGFFSSLDKYNKSGGGDGKRRLLSAFNAQKWSTSRKSKDGITEERYIAKGAMGIFGNIQPGLFKKMFSIDDVNQGLPQRFMYIRAVIDQHISPYTPDIPHEVDEILERITRRLLSIEMEIDANGDYQPRVLKLEPNAKAVFDLFCETVAKRTFRTVAYEFAVKWLQICLRIALLLQLLEWASRPGDDTPEPEYITYDVMTCAQIMSECLMNHTEAARQYMPGASKAKRDTPAMLDCEEQLTSIIKDMSDEDKKIFRTREEVQALLSTEVSKEQIGKILSKLGISQKQTRKNGVRERGYYFSDMEK